MRIERTSGRFVAERKVSSGIVVLAILSVVVLVLFFVRGSSGSDGLRSVLVLVFLLVLVLAYWRSYRIEVDAVSERITITKRTVFKGTEMSVGFRDVKRILWSRTRLPFGRTLHRLDLMGDESVNVIDEPFRSLDSWSAADVSIIANGIAQLVRVPIEERAF